MAEELEEEISYEEQEKFRYIEQNLKELKESIKIGDDEATINNIARLKEKIADGDEKLKVLSDMFQKTTTIYGDFVYETIHKLIVYDYDPKLLKYLKLFVEMSDKILIDTFNYSALIYFMLKVSKNKFTEFGQMEIEYSENKYSITLARQFNVNNANMEQVNEALLNILLNVEVSIKAEDEEDNT